MGKAAVIDTGTQEGDSRFLMQATFGPTRSSLAAKQGKHFVDWMLDQMNTTKFPMESHREYYRMHVNLPFKPVLMPRFEVRGVAEEGSRWHRYAITVSDKGLTVSISGPADARTLVVAGVQRGYIDPTSKGGQCTNVKPPKGKGCNAASEARCVKSQWRTPGYCKQTCFDLGYAHPGDDCSGGWAQFVENDFNGYICKAESKVGGMILMGTDEECSSGHIAMLNPAIHLTPKEAAAVGHGVFESVNFLPDVLFLKSSAQDLNNTHYVEHGGSHYMPEPRMKLRENTIKRPAGISLRSGGCLPRNPFNSEGCQVLPPGGPCALACGSAGEVANDPRAGHLLAMHTLPKKNTALGYPVNDYDAEGNEMVDARNARAVVWVARALEAKDQLRQRMAWALSQILVAASQDKTAVESELWTGFYDVFLRHAFGNYRELLREVTYHPVMGGWLTYVGSTSYNSDLAYADENYAREIMQLFSIGLTKLHPNGSSVLDGQGNEVPTYSNENIMSFARVFTGFGRVPERLNVEYRIELNQIDPMQMLGHNHDPYPKPDLEGGYLGDQYPLCSDAPKRAWLVKGARYEFLGYDYGGKHERIVHDLIPGSNLFAMLCNAELSGACTFKNIIELNATLSCTLDECGHEGVVVVKVGVGLYEYVPAPCVHPFFANGTTVVEATKKGFSQHCVDSSLPAAGVSCCSGCKDVPPPKFNRKKFSCQDVFAKLGNKMLKKCKRDKEWGRKQWCAWTCAQKGAGYPNLKCIGKYSEGGVCAQDVSSGSAQALCTKLGMEVCQSETKFSTQCGSGVWTSEACTQKVRVHADTKISGNTDYHGPNRFEAFWAGGEKVPEGEYDATVVLKPVFDHLPDPEKLAQLKIGAFPQVGACTHPVGCAGPVKAYAGVEGLHSTGTVFEHKGKYFKNAASIVTVGQNAFRNPPVFLRPGLRRGLERDRASLAEVESLLDHIFFHPNVPVFIGKKLIQRFTTSNPSPVYLEVVAKAFSTGSYAGIGGGRYGDLAATLAAILLHQEARRPASASDGLLREPLLKVLHFMRSMEYMRLDQRPVFFQDLSAQMGQFPFMSPTVFNFFEADYMPPSFEHFSELEPEPEPQPEPMVAPEVQIFTPPLAMGFLNGMSTLVYEQKSDDGIVKWTGPKAGELRFGVNGTIDEMLKELDLLLTGGRLTPQDAATVRTAYDGAPAGEKLKAAQEAIVMTPEFHIFGPIMPNGTRPKSPTPVKEHQPQSYRAVVLLFMAGGADTYHMLVPVGCNLYNEYKKVRDGIHHEQDKLLPIESPKQPRCKSFGVHPKLPFIADLYNKEQAAFVSNIGALVQPLSRSTMQTSKKCLKLFSHSHAQTAAHTLHCQIPGVAPRGVGGRIADDIAARHQTASFSLAGKATWSGGFDTNTEIVHPTRGAVRYSRYAKVKETVLNITSQQYGGVFCEEYAKLFQEAVDSSEHLGTLLDKVKLKTESSWKPSTDLSSQLYQVARLIQSRVKRSAERDFFFVQIGGFDTHKVMKDTLDILFADMNDSIEKFVAEMKAQNVFDSVVMATESDFGRTLDKNGNQGTDHGWGGNQFVLGGSINGKNIFNEFLSSYLPGTEQDAGRGRVIPQYPWESMMVPIAEWMGIADASTVFPNLKYFNRSSHIINNLFKPRA